MKVTSTRVRILGGDGIYAIASVTIDKQLTINDIKVERHGNEFTVKMPKTETAKLNHQYTIHVNDDRLYKEIKAKILDRIAEIS